MAFPLGNGHVKDTKLTRPGIWGRGQTWPTIKELATPGSLDAGSCIIELKIVAFPMDLALKNLSLKN